MSDNNIVPAGGDGISGSQVPDMFRDQQAPKPPVDDKPVQELKRQRAGLIVALLVALGVVLTLYFLYGSTGRNEDSMRQELLAAQKTIVEKDNQILQITKERDEVRQRYAYLEYMRSNIAASSRRIKDYMAENPLYRRQLNAKTLDDIETEVDLQGPVIKELTDRYERLVVVEKETRTYQPPPPAPPKPERGAMSIE